EFEPGDVYGITTGKFNHEDGPWTTTIEVKGDECTYLASHNSGHFKKVVWKKGVGLVEYASGYGAHADGYRLKRTTTTQNRQMEASEALDIFHSSDGFPAPVNKTIRDGLRDYLTSVYKDEVQRMSQGDISLYSGEAHTQLTALFYQMDEKSIPNRELYAESLRCLNKLAEYRRLRIFAGNNT